MYHVGATLVVALLEDEASLVHVIRVGTSPTPTRFISTILRDELYSCLV